jgi:hypothetical protein
MAEKPHMTPAALRTLDLLLRRGGYPHPNYLVLLKVAQTIEDAQAMIDEHRALNRQITHPSPVAEVAPPKQQVVAAPVPAEAAPLPVVPDTPVPVPPTAPEPKKEHLLEKVSHALHSAAIGDVFALLVAMGVDLVFNFVFFQFIAVDTLTRVGFSAVVFFIVFYKVRALMEASKAERKGTRAGWLLLYVPLMLSTLFGGVSFTLLDIHYQSTKGDVTQDAGYKALDDKVKKKQAAEDDLQAQYKEATKRETMDQLFTLWQRAISAREATERDAALYLELPHIEAKKAFTAIQDAWVRGEYSACIFVFIIFLSIEGGVFGAVAVLNRRRKLAPVQGQ